MISPDFYDPPYRGGHQCPSSIKTDLLSIVVLLFVGVSEAICVRVLSLYVLCLLMWLFFGGL